MEQKIGKAGVRDAIIGFGVSVDKYVALTSQAPSVQVAVLNMPTAEDRQAQRDIDAKLDAIVRKLNE